MIQLTRLHKARVKELVELPKQKDLEDLRLRSKLKLDL